MNTSKTTALLSLLLLSSAVSAATNRAPSISRVPATSVEVKKSYRFYPAATDPEGSKLTFTVKNKPSWAWFDSNSGAIGGEPQATGTHSNIVISASDGKASASLPAFSITVTKASGSNAAPVLSGTPAASVSAGSAYSFQPKASDANGDRLSFSISNKPSWATFNTTSGQLTGTPQAGNVGKYSNIVISTTDGKASASLPAFSITATANTSTTNAAPRLSGSPAAVVALGSAYAFQPTATDANGDTLAFSIANKPSWATFNTATGRLSGSPQSGNVATYSGIVISVSDGKAAASLPAFAIAVTRSSSGSVVLSWTPPTSNADGSTLVNLAGYRIYFGSTANTLNQVIEVSNPGIASYVVQSLPAGKHYFAVKAYSANGMESDHSAVASKTVL